jgi:hypothetical protein
MKLRAWLVLPLAALLGVGSFVAANTLLLRHIARAAPPTGDFLNTIDLPLWWWLLVIAPPLIPIGAYVWQRTRRSDSD